MIVFNNRMNERLLNFFYLRNLQVLNCDNFHIDSGGPHSNHRESSLTLKQTNFYFGSINKRVFVRAHTKVRTNIICWSMFD